MGPARQKRGSLYPIQGRPPVGPLGSFSDAVITQLDALRPNIEGWGAETLRVELEDQKSLQGKRIPSVRSINHYLKVKGRVRAYGRPSTLVQETLCQGQFAHDVWQLDAEGNKAIAKLGTVSFINIKDTFSKSYVVSSPVFLQGPKNHPKRSDYQHAIRLGWMRFGLNRTFQFDHESIFFDNTHASPYPTPLCLWVTGMGVSVSYTPKGKPWKQGCVERSHQTLDRQICQGKSFDSQDALWQKALERCNKLNERIPCRTLPEGLPPLRAYPEAKRSSRPYDLESEEESFDQTRIKQYLKACKPWFRTVTANRCVVLGRKQYFLKDSTPAEELSITFNPETSNFDFRNSQQKLIATKQAKGILYQDLKGNLSETTRWIHQRPELFSKNKK